MVLASATWGNLHPMDAQRTCVQSCTSLGSPELVVDSEDRSSVDMASYRLERERDLGSEHYIPGTRGAIPERARGTISLAHVQLSHYFSDVV